MVPRPDIWYFNRELGHTLALRGDGGNTMSNLDQLLAEPRHLVVICGGAVSGSEAAAMCAARGMLAVVLEQNTRPYGKIEDGLPRWHDKLRRQEYARIDENLTQPGVLFVPRVTLGRD